MNQISIDRFTPIRGTESQILASNPVKGYLWFAIDTKRIYYSDGLNFIPIGGNSSIYYGKMVAAETPEEGQTLFDFSLDDIDGNEELVMGESYKIPNVDDLILNIPDGCFYRVLAISDTTITTKKLTIAGSGTGGGSGSGSAAAGQARMNKITQDSIVSLYQRECPIKFNFTAIDKDGESTGSAPGYVTINNTKVLEFTAIQGLNTLDIGPYLNLGDSNIVFIFVNANVGGFETTLISKKWTVKTVSVQLTWNYDETTANYVDRSLMLSWDVSGNIEKTTNIIIDDFHHLTIGPSLKTNGWGKTFSSEEFEEYRLNHGAHKFEMYITLNIDGQEIRTESIFKDIIIIDPDVTTPIISCNFTQSSISQYNTVQLPIIIFNPKSEGYSKIQLRENDQLKDTWNEVSNLVKYFWSYTPVTSGEQTLMILCNEAEKRLRINVEALNIDNSESGGYAFKFKASDFSSNIALQNWNSNDITASFSNNFDWINGGIQTEKDKNNVIRQFVCIKAGTSMTIDYPMFDENASRNGKVVKVIFKATKCRDYDAQVLKCYDDESNIGLILRAQDAIFKSEQATIQTQYCEDSYLEFETDIWTNPRVPEVRNGVDVSQRYIMTWLDGVPSGVSIYAANDSFRNTQTITIGSNDCDVQLYLLKVYERHLSDEEHLSNFIADAPSAEEMLDRFKRNDILDDRGEISYLKLAKANPNCLVHLYEMDHISTHKKTDIVNGCSYIQYHGSDEATLSAENVTVKVQGTSSAKYGTSAFNLDMKFNDGFNLADGTHIQKWSMTENAIPVNYFNYKVNVASCEQANNALNQEWYNRFQPYICRYRRKEPRARDTMQFTPGVLFIKDNNQTTNDNDPVKNNAFKEIDGYVQNPYYKVYSICNMGNAKKNTNVFHDEDNPLECCVEVTDNQTRGQWMTEIPGYTTDDKGNSAYVGEISNGNVVFSYDEEDNIVGASLEGLTAEELAQWEIAISDAAFEFRYPDGAATSDHKAAFFRLVQWMSQNDPSPKYEPVEIKNEEWFNKKINGYYADEENQKDWVDPITLYTEHPHPSAAGVIHEEINEYDSEENYFAIVDHPHGYTGEALPQPVIYPAYTFKDTEFTQKLKNLTISLYAGTYETDCYEYRMAKLLSECENYLIMDAVVFHYLFIERHTMIDNVAKNTFWSTEDLIHWAPIKDYDNDTADGNDNQGKLTLSYGLEAMDPIEDRFVFNAHQAVWFNFINGVQPACAKLYADLKNVGAWDSKSYLKLFEDWQNSIPERVWIECYYRLYLRPRQIYGDETFVPMLEGGKKTHQRKQYETYQNYYIDSKYTDSGSNAITLRTYGTDLLNYAIPVTMYCDCYIKTDWGQNQYNKRVKRKEVNNILCPVNSTNNATVYFYFPELYQTIGNVGGLAPDLVNTSSAIRLRELILGTEEEGNANLRTVQFMNNQQLEKLVAVNLPNTNIPLDLSGAASLKELDTRGSGFTGIIIADGAPLEKLQAEAPSSLVLTNLKYINNFHINDYNNLTTLYLDNIDDSPGINSKDLINNSNRLSFYGLKNVQWTINSNEELSLENKTINILEKLLPLSGKDTFGNELSKTVALTGSMYITEDAYNINDSFDIYDKYAQNEVFPSLNIYFEGDLAKLYTITIYNGNDEINWQRNIIPNNDVDETFLSDGPNGMFNIENIRNSKSETESTTFNFTNTWEVYNKEGTLLETIDSEEPTFENVEEDLIFKPIFEGSVRKYEVKFYNGDVLLNPSQYIVEYGTLAKDCIPSMIPYRSDDGLPAEQTNGFVGYSFNSEKKSLLSDNFIITDNYNFYAWFETKSVYDNVLDSKYYQLTGVTNGYMISKKTGIDYIGKITLPIVNPENGLPILGVSNNGFDRQNSLTHVYWERKNNLVNQVRSFGNNAFSQNINLKYVEMPNSVATVGRSCFQNCPLLFSESSQEEIDQFFKNLVSIGELSFNRVGVGNFNEGLDTIVILKLSDQLISIGSRAFAAGGFKNVQIGNQGEPSSLMAASCGNEIFLNSYINSFIIYVSNSSDSNWTTLREKFNLTLAESGSYTIMDT